MAKKKKKTDEPMVKQNGEEDEEDTMEEDEGSEEENEGKEAMSKSEEIGITGEDLQKSLDKLEEAAKEGNAPTRKEDLLSKASSGDLSGIERSELFEILGGTPQAAEEEDHEVSDNIVKSLTSNNEIENALDVSEYLKEQHTELVKSLSAVGDEISKSDNRRMEFDLVMAKALHDIGTMVKSMSETVGDFAAEPARAPKSKGVQGASPAQHLEKSMAGVAAQGDELSRDQLFTALDSMMEKSMAQHKDGQAECGKDIAFETSKLEQTGKIAPELYAEVKRHIAAQ